MTSQPGSADEMQSLEFLATAVAGRSVQVRPAACGELSWTDGRVIFIDKSLSDSDQLLALFVQASLLSAGSFAPAILRQLKRHARLASRYLCVEAYRALHANQALLPGAVSSRFTREESVNSDSPDASLEVARSNSQLAELMPSLGSIRVRELLKQTVDGQASGRAVQTRIHSQHRQGDVLLDLDDDTIDDDPNSGAAADKFTLGGIQGIPGSWLQRFLQSVRRGSATGTPGADAPTHRYKASPRRGISVLSTAAAGAVDEDVESNGVLKYPEWDMNLKRYRIDWCTVQEVDPVVKDTSLIPQADFSSLCRPLARIGLGLDHCHRQSQGDDIDIDAAIEARIESLVGSPPDENVYIDRIRRRRDLSALILLDISGSVAEPVTDRKTVHEMQLATAAALAAALHKFGDRVAIYAYNSRGRGSVQLFPVKYFDDHFSSLTLQRLYSLIPSAYSRLGTAIRHGADVLEKQGGTPRRVLVVLSDGLAYDHGYEKEYGAADARRALAEARRRGTGSLCLTFGSHSDALSLQRVFGTAAHAVISRPSQISGVIGKLFRSALRSAEVRRRV